MIQVREVVRLLMTESPSSNRDPKGRNKETVRLKLKDPASDTTKTPVKEDDVDPDNVEL
jgi:hypothetical protein